MWIIRCDLKKKNEALGHQLFIMYPYFIPESDRKLIPWRPPMSAHRAAWALPRKPSRYNEVRAFQVIGYGSNYEGPGKIRNHSCWPCSSFLGSPNLVPYPMTINDHGVHHRFYPWNGSGAHAKREKIWVVWHCFKFELLKNVGDHKLNKQN